MPLENWMPRWDVRSAHQVVVAASQDRVYQALISSDLSRNPILAALMALRAIPALLFSPRTTWTSWRTLSSAGTARPTRNLLSGAFVQLEATPPSGIVLGLTGRFWSLAGGLVTTDPDTFRDPVPPGMARAVWSFEIDPVALASSRLRTETRVLCADPASRARFLRYWGLIHRGSAVIRWALLRQIKSAAEVSSA